MKKKKRVHIPVGDMKVIAAWHRMILNYRKMLKIERRYETEQEKEKDQTKA